MATWNFFIARVVISLIVGTVLIHIGAKATRIKNASLLKAFESAIAGAMVGLLLTIVAGAVSEIISLYVSAFVFLVAAFTVLVAIIKNFYGTTWLKALVTWIIYIIILIPVSIVISAVTQIPITSVIG